MHPERVSEIVNVLTTLVIAISSPYIILGTLREQLMYPLTNREMINTELQVVLQQVNLQNVLNRNEEILYEQLTDLSISTIRSKASRGNLIIAKDGFTYRYEKNPQILKWLKIL